MPPTLAINMPPSADENDAQAQPADESDAALVARLRQRDEAAFVLLIERYQVPLRRFLRNYVPNDDLAEEVAQETWVAVLGALENFEGRSALKTWLFRIGANRAQSRMKRERRTIPFASLRTAYSRDSSEEPDLDALLPPTFSSESGMWSSAPAHWDDQPEHKVLSDETFRVTRETVSQLPPVQAAVITLRDIEQWTAAEVCEALNLSAANQRVLLHRARLKVRKAIEQHLAEESS